MILECMVSPAPFFRTPPQLHAYIAPWCIWTKKHATWYCVNTTGKVVVKAVQEVCCTVGVRGALWVWQGKGGEKGEWYTWKPEKTDCSDTCLSAADVATIVNRTHSGVNCDVYCHVDLYVQCMWTDTNFCMEEGKSARIVQKILGATIKTFVAQYLCTLAICAHTLSRQLDQVYCRWRIM